MHAFHWEGISNHYKKGGGSSKLNNYSKHGTHRVTKKVPLSEAPQSRISAMLGVKSFAEAKANEKGTPKKLVLSKRLN